MKSTTEHRFIKTKVLFFHLWERERERERVDLMSKIGQCNLSINYGIYKLSRQTEKDAERVRVKV